MNTQGITKTVLWVLLVYSLVVLGVAWWTGQGLRAVAHDLMGDSARLIGRDVTGALYDVSAEDLLGGDLRARARLRRAVQPSARNSTKVTGLSIIDAGGTVVGSDDPTAIGQQLAVPATVFAQDLEPRLVSTFEGLFDTGTHRLLTPVFNGPALAGYIRVNLTNQAIGHLYGVAFSRLLVLALTGFLMIIAIGVVLLLRLSRFQQRLATIFDPAVAEKDVENDRERIREDETLDRIRFATQRMRRELEMARVRTELNRTELDTVATVSKFGILVIGSAGTLEFSNHIAQDMLTAGRPERLVDQFVKLRERLQQTAASVWDGERPHIGMDMEFMIEAATRRFRIDLYALMQEGSHSFLVIMRDCELIEALEADLYVATRFRSLPTLFVGAAHDLRGPLNNMVVHLELLKQSLKTAGQGPGGEPDKARSRRPIGVIQQEIYRLDRYVQALVDLAVPVRGGSDVLDIGRILTEIAGLIQAQARLQRVRFDVRVPDRPVMVNSRQAQLRQMLLNIIINALEAMPSGGTLTVVLRQEIGHVTVAIRDTGIGIPEALQRHIFDMHFTTKTTGTGIGLYVADSVVRQHGGSVMVQSKPGEGSCFTVRLPLAAAESDHASAAEVAE